MRKVELNMTEELKYNVIKKLVENNGNKDRKPVNVIDESTVQEIITLYDNKYHDANFTHLAELLEEQENIKVSKSFLRERFLKEGIVSPMATRKLKKRVKQQLEIKKKQANSKKEQEYIQKQIVNLVRYLL
ncbi:hypothetical protein PRVXH_001043 [Proteinivorax hydrogeniformans]|uniref:Transposase n=1 Tax=Proteinivorax hydrogeniformans TaxID=1826727 RepID=A0AAU8HWG6_9FIRM